MNLKSKYPNLLSKIDEEINENRFLVTVDVNYDDDDSDEFDIFNPDEYNYLVYINERVQNVLGEEKMSELITKLESLEIFENFINDEIDLYGVYSSKNEEEIEAEVLKTVEELLS